MPIPSLLDLSHAEKQKVFSRSCGLQDLSQYSDCALSRSVWLLQTNEHLSRLSFQQQWARSGAASLSAAICWMWHTAEKRFVRHVCVRNLSLPILFGIPNIHSLPEAGSWEPQHIPSFQQQKKSHVSCPDLAFSLCGFSPCSQNATHFRKAICSTYLLKASIPAIPWEVPNIHSLPEASRSWEPRYAPPIPSLQLQKRTPISCRGAERLVTELSSPRFVTIQWLCSQFCYETASNQRIFVEIELLARLGWKCGCRSFSRPCSQNVTHCRKEICSTCLSNESFLANPFGISKHPLSNRSFRFLRAAVRSISSALWLHHAHPFVAAAEKNIHLMQRSRAFGHGVVVSKVCYNTVIVLSVLLWDCFKPKNICRDWAFSDSGLEV